MPILHSRSSNFISCGLLAGDGLNIAQLDPKTAEQLSAFQNPQMLLDHPKREQLRETLPADIQPVVTQMIDTLRDALSASLTTVFLAGAALVVVAFLLTFFLREIPLRTSNKMPATEKEAGKSSKMNPRPVNAN